jgi:hypothetical protein
MKLTATGLLAIMMGAACSSSLPMRYVIERDLGSYHYRRYQETLEAELPIAGNRAHGHNAVYLQRNAQGVAAISAFVTVYERPARLTETVRAELAQLPGYELRTEKIAGQYVWLLAAKTETSFWIWPSGQHLVKLGAPAGQAVPESIADPYASLYPSDLDSFGHARAGTASGGALPDAEDPEEAAPAANSAQRTGNAAPAGPGALAEAGVAR